MLAIGTRWIAVALLCAAGFVTQALAADETVKQAQRLLLALGYKIGSADGVSGSRTEAAMADVMARYGQAYDGTISDNEVLLLARVAPYSISVDLIVPVSEIMLLDHADITGDGRPDFVVTALSDSEAQMGVPCCEVPVELLSKITPPVPVLVYSTPDGYATLPFPPETKGNKSQSGKFFRTPKGQYFVLAKNGEMGLPDDNFGEPSMVLRIDGGATPTLTVVAEYEGPGVTANVEVADLDGDGWPEIFLNNYDDLGQVADGNISTIKTFGEDEKLTPTSFNPALEPRKAHNFIRVDDIDGNGKLDMLAAAEIWKSLDGKQMMSAGPGSYVILDAFNRATEASDRLYLLPPHYGNDHAGFDIMPVHVGDRTFLFEVAMKFLGHQGGGFNFDNLDVFEFKAGDHSITKVTEAVLPQFPEPRENAGGFRIERADINFDGINDVYRQKYPRKPHYYAWSGSFFELRTFPAKKFFDPGWVGNQTYLPDAELKCTRLLTSPQWLGGSEPVLEMQMTACIPGAEL